MADIMNRTYVQQQRLWLEVAELALRRWDLRADELRWLGHGSKAIIRVRAMDADYILRLYLPEQVNVKWLRSELTWLSNLRRATDLLAPFPLPAPVNGIEETLLELRHDRLPQARIAYAALFEFIAGDTKSARDLRPVDVFRVGEYLGLLHTIGQFSPPAGFDRPGLQWEGIFGDDSPYASLATRDLIGDEQRAILDDLALRLRRPLSNLAARGGATGLIHADLLAKNIVFRERTIAALDFEFCGWGFFLYDLAPLLWELKGERARDYAELEAAIWRGYTSIRPLADSDRELLEPFIAARQYASIRWLLANLGNPTVKQVATSLIAERCEELKGFLESGMLRRSTPTL